jgi:polyhydroxyalkanoate synthesis regulator phasin
VPEDRAKVLRAKFDLSAAVLNRKVDKVCEDGTVTREEAKEVRELVQKMVQEHKKEHGGKNKK